MVTLVCGKYENTTDLLSDIQQAYANIAERTKVLDFSDFVPVHLPENDMNGIMVKISF